MSYKIPRISPSALAATERCPGFRPDGEDTQAATDGTMFHDEMRLMVETVPRSQWRNWVATRTDAGPQIMGLMEQAEAALETVVLEDLKVYANVRLRMRGGKPRKAPLKPGLYPELELERGQGRHGYVDLLVVTPEGLVYIIDYKSNRVGKDFSWQLGAYAVDVNSLCEAHRDFICMIVAPRLDDEEQLRMRIGEKELATLRERIGRIERRADDFGTNDETVGVPGDHCEHCHRKGTCKWHAAATGAVSAAVTEDYVRTSEKKGKVTVVPSLASLVGPGGAYEGQAVTAETFTNPRTVEQRGLRRACLKFLEVMIDAAKKDDSRWAAQYTDAQLRDLVPGFSVSRRNGRGSFDQSKVPEVRGEIMAKFSMSVEDVFGVSVPDKDMLVKSLVEVNGFTKKRAEEEVKRVFEPFTTPGAPTLYWTQKAPARAAAIEAEPTEARRLS